MMAQVHVRKGWNRLLDVMRKLKDRWDGMVSIRCPNGRHWAERLPVYTAKHRPELLVVCIVCGHRFVWTVPSRLRRKFKS